MPSLVSILGDTHADTKALFAAASEASLRGCSYMFHVGDLWWQPDTPSHQGVRDTLYKISHDLGVCVVLTDGNNDDVLDLLSHNHTGSLEAPFAVCDGLMYAPRGSVLNVASRKIGFLGGAPSYKNPRFPNSENSTDLEVSLISNKAPLDVLFTHDAPVESTDVLGINPSWGLDSRVRVSRALNATNPSFLFHGHYHKSASLKVGLTSVYGLDRDRLHTPDIRFLDLETLALI